MVTSAKTRLEYNVGVWYTLRENRLRIMKKVIGIIPARFGSTRLYGKPLINIAGKSLIQRTYENAKKCKSLNQIIVATDDELIFNHVKSFSGEVVMTSVDCLTGTDRIIEVLKGGAYDDSDIVVDIQGDAPNVESEVIEKVISVLVNDPEAVVSTPIMKLITEEDALKSSIVKCVVDQKGRAIYFSRSLIPGNKAGGWNPEITYYKHIGIYCYRREFLTRYGELTPTPLQLTECLEQLKIIENGYKIAVAVVESSSIEIDTLEDVQKLEKSL